jgi:pantothenate kinase
MDGFHYDNAVLDQLGLRSRKGAPETFDYAGFAATLKRIQNCESCVAVPVFDRTIDLARAGAEIISDATQIVIVEGNYLLLDESPWDQIHQYFNLTIFLDIPRAQLQRRLMQRWLNHGRTAEQAAHWVTTNDMPNVDRVLSRRRTADFSINPQFEI